MQTLSYLGKIDPAVHAARILPYKGAAKVSAAAQAVQESLKGAGSRSILIMGLRDAYYARLQPFVDLVPQQQFSFVTTSAKPPKVSLPPAEEWKKLLLDITVSIRSIKRCFSMKRPDDVNGDIRVRTLTLRPQARALEELGKQIYSSGEHIKYDRYIERAIATQRDETIKCSVALEADGSVAGGVLYQHCFDAVDKQGQPDPHVLIEDFLAKGDRSPSVPDVLFARVFSDDEPMNTQWRAGIKRAVGCEQVRLEKRIHTLLDRS